MSELVTYSKRKALALKENGRSSDYIFPSIIMGCAFSCKYCYCRRHKTEGFDVATNLDEILESVDNQTKGLSWPKIPNQCDLYKYVLDIGCNTDVGLMSKKYIDWKTLFQWFIDRPRLKGTFATKYVNRDFLDFNPKNSMRIRFSLMPQEVSSVMEPGTTSIENRIKAINDFIEAGYEVHLNFSPVIYYGHSSYKERYVKLFEQVNDLVKEYYKPFVHSEIIFLTHDKKLHEYNVSKKFKHEFLLWNPDLQEEKVTSYGGDALRYKSGFKAVLVKEFLELHQQCLPWNKVRYVF